MHKIKKGAEVTSFFPLLLFSLQLSHLSRGGDMQALFVLSLSSHHHSMQQKSGRGKGFALDVLGGQLCSTGDDFLMVLLLKNNKRVRSGGGE